MVVLELIPAYLFSDHGGFLPLWNLGYSHTLGLPHRAEQLNDDVIMLKTQ